MAGLGPATHVFAGRIRRKYGRPAPVPVIEMEGPMSRNLCDLVSVGLDYILFCFSVSIRSLAAGPDEAGFWPVISWPSATV